MQKSAKFEANRNLAFYILESQIGAEQLVSVFMDENSASFIEKIKAKFGNSQIENEFQKAIDQLVGDTNKDIKNKEYFEEFVALEKEFLKTPKAKNEFVNYLSSQYKINEAIMARKMLISQNNEDAIITDAFSINSYGSRDEQHLKEVQLLQNYIIKADSDSLTKKAFEEIFRSPVTLVIPQLLEFLENKATKEKKVIYLRNFYDYFKVKKQNKKALEYLKFAYSYGDVYSGLKLAEIYLEKKYTKKAAEILENLSKKGDIRASEKLKHI